MASRWWAARALVIVMSCMLILTGACGHIGTNEGGGILRELTPPPQRPVIVVSGFGNTRLFDPVTQRFVWGTAHSFLQTSYADSLDLPVDPATGQIGRDRLVPRGYLAMPAWFNIGYNLQRALRRDAGYTPPPSEVDASTSKGLVYSFFYDWRLSAIDNTRLLDRFIEQVLAEHGDPGLEVDLIGHSNGGFIIYTYLKLGVAGLDEPESWDSSASKAALKVDRAIMMSTPLRGSAEAFRFLNQTERFLMRTLHPWTTATFPSVTDLLPDDGRILIDETGAPIEADLWDPATWRRLGLSIYQPALQQDFLSSHSRAELDLLEKGFEDSIRRARRLRDALNRPYRITVPVSIVGSDCFPTSRRVLRRKDGSLAFYERQLLPSEKKLVPIMLEPGDGSISLRSAVKLTTEPANRDLTHLAVFCEGHQAMASDRNVQRSVIRTLQE